MKKEHMMMERALPNEDGYRMPGEFERHRGCIMIWPYRRGSWPYGASRAREIFAEIAMEIARSETVYLLVRPMDQQEFDQYVASGKMVLANIVVLPISSDDAWARDTAPTFLVSQEGDLRAVNWEFNAWGGTYDGLYSSWEEDNLLAKRVCERLGISYYDASPFVLEGGSIHSDGEGTLLVTEACLLSPGRNPQLSRLEIEEYLHGFLGIRKVIWLPCGIYLDETNEHVDNICAFVKPGEVVLAWTDQKDDPQYEMSRRCEEVLRMQTDACGRSFRVHKLPIPKTPLCIQREDLEGYEFAEGEQPRELGERLAASYVNYYCANDAILLPQFEDPSDEEAVSIMKELYPDRRIVPIMTREILLGGGNIHCITQQIPQFVSGSQTSVGREFT